LATLLGIITGPSKKKQVPKNPKKNQTKIPKSTVSPVRLLAIGAICSNECKVGILFIVPDEH